MRNPVNKADHAASEASGLPPYFYVIKRRDGDAAASNWLAIRSILFENEETDEETVDDFWSTTIDPDHPDYNPACERR